MSSLIQRARAHAAQVYTWYCTFCERTFDMCEVPKCCPLCGVQPNKLKWKQEPDNAEGVHSRREAEAYEGNPREDRGDVREGHV